MDRGMHVRMHVCMYACMYVCMYACIYVCVCVSTYARLTYETPHAGTSTNVRTNTKDRTFIAQ
jgi:hypothetical protein